MPKTTSRPQRGTMPRNQRVVIGSGFMCPALDASRIDESGVMATPGSTARPTRAVSELFLL